MAARSTRCVPAFAIFVRDLHQLITVGRGESDVAVNRDAFPSLLVSRNLVQSRGPIPAMMTTSRSRSFAIDGPAMGGRWPPAQFVLGTGGPLGAYCPRLEQFTPSQRLCDKSVGLGPSRRLLTRIGRRDGPRDGLPLKIVPGPQIDFRDPLGQSWVLPVPRLSPSNTIVSASCLVPTPSTPLAFFLLPFPCLQPRTLQPRYLVLTPSRPYSASWAYRPSCAARPCISWARCGATNRHCGWARFGVFPH